MEWLNLHSSVLDSPEVVGAEPTDRATWLFLLRYCIGQENGGVILDCQSWGDRKWQQLVRITLPEVKRVSTLWRMNGQDLEVNFYPIEKQKEIEAKREAGRSTVAKRWGKRNCSADSSAICSAHTEGEGKGREGEQQSLNEVSANVSKPTPLQIYEAYPRKVGPAAALKAISKALKAKPPADLLAATQAYANAVKTWPEPDKCFIPHPATWFNRGSYDDDPATWQRDKYGKEISNYREKGLTLV